jgi:hypothetical protein
MLITSVITPWINKTKWQNLSAKITCQPRVGLKWQLSGQGSAIVKYNGFPAHNTDLSFKIHLTCMRILHTSKRLSLILKFYHNLLYISTILFCLWIKTMNYTPQIMKYVTIVLNKSEIFTNQQPIWLNIRMECYIGV